MANIAVIDLGTNTFHLLIARANRDQSFEVLFKERKYVKLAEEGIDSIGERPFERGVAAMEYFGDVLSQYQVDQIKAVGTAALRTASNGGAFVDIVKRHTGIRIELIDGLQEAEYIYHGVNRAIPHTTDNFLIMDVGGGSVEFILANSNRLIWRKSFPIGVAVLYKSFHHSEPIDASEIGRLSAFLDQAMEPLANVLSESSVKYIVGSSGTFDVLGTLTGAQRFGCYMELDIPLFKPFYEEVIRLDLAGRLNHPVIPDTRADMIVVALILIARVLAIHPFEKIWVSEFAMKEGILSQLIVD